MSLRRKTVATLENADSLDPTLLKQELEQLREQHLQNEATFQASATDSTTGIVTQAMRDFDTLSPTEQQAAGLGVHPDAFRPLKELNEQHFEALRQANALSPTLEANIRAFKKVAEQS